MSPTVLREGPFRFFFYSNENQEPPHVHVVSSSGGKAKYWLEPVELCSSKKMKAPELTILRALVPARRADFLEKWNAYFA